MKQTISSKQTNGHEHKRSSFNYYFFFFVFALFSFSNMLNAQIENFQVGTTTRKMLAYAPSGIEPNRPLLISLHGMNQDIAYQQGMTKWELVAKENNFVVVYPGGINNSWDLSGNSDIDFILAIIDEMVKRYGIDRDRVYLSGFSMGGMMTYYAANKIADKIAAFAPVSGYLMGGPNTKSARPIPIIHTHGTADDVVAYSGVSTCLNAWVTRNGCPKTSQITKPYPVGKNTEDSRTYWGPGTDSVEIVLITLNGKGHFHSRDAYGVNTTQEIWDFCKKFTLSFGVPKFKTAFVNNANPKQIQVKFSLPIKKLDKYTGFAVKIDGQAVTIDTVLFTDSLHLAINLASTVLKTNEIHVSYNNGNLLSVYEKPLASFNDTLAENLLSGAAPRIIEFAVTANGDSLVAKFNKKMLMPADISSLALKATFEGDKNVPLTQYSYLKNDSSVLVFPLGIKIYADYKLNLSYTGNTLVSIDSGIFKNNLNYEVANKSKGLPVHVVSGVLDSSAIAIDLEFSKPMYMKDSQKGQFTLKVNGVNVTIKEVFALKNLIKFVLSANLYHGDSIKVSYTPGDITASDKGELDAFADLIVKNPLELPSYSELPGKIEAENFALQNGIATETVSDDGGGLNVGWTEAGDWLVYAIENNTNDTVYQILFRIAAQSSGAAFAYYIDNVKKGQLNVPSTGGWQTWQSVVKDIAIPKGKHYLKIVVTSSGFNINYFEVQKFFVSVNKSKLDNINIYPNPASNRIVIKSTDFKYDKIVIFDIKGQEVFAKSITYQPELLLPLDLNNGIYLLKLSNGKSFYSQKINIVK